jgi:hypothetical protein
LRKCSVLNRKTDKFDARGAACFTFTFEIEVRRLLTCQKRNNNVDTRIAPRPYFIFDPIAAARSGSYCQPAAPWSVDPMKFRMHFLLGLLYYDLSRERIYIDSATAQDLDAVVAVKQRAVWSCLQAALLTRLKGNPDCFRCEQLELL